jgi:hypothetical protein
MVPYIVEKFFQEEHGSFPISISLNPLTPLSLTSHLSLQDQI